MRERSFQFVDVLLVFFAKHFCHARMKGKMGVQILVWASKKEAVCCPMRYRHSILHCINNCIYDAALPGPPLPPQWVWVYRSYVPRPCVGGWGGVVVVVSPSPPCGVVRVWYCPPPPCGVVGVWYCAPLPCGVVGVWLYTYIIYVYI